MLNVHLPVPVDHEEGDVIHPGRGVHSGGKDTQVGVESLPGTQLQQEGPTLLFHHSELSQQIPNEMVGSRLVPSILGALWGGMLKFV